MHSIRLGCSRRCGAAGCVRKANILFLCLLPAFDSADLSPKLGQLSRHLIEILASRQTEHCRGRLRYIILPASQLQSGLKELLLGLEKTVGTLIPN
jgi:hypothetical protein